MLDDTLCWTTRYVGRHADFLYCEDVFLSLMNDDDEVVNLLVFISFINRQ